MKCFNKCLRWLIAATVILLSFTPKPGYSQTTILCGQTVTNTTTSPSQIDSYVYNGIAGETLVFAFLWLGGGYPYDQGSADIYTPGNQFLTNVAVVQGGNVIRLTLPTSGVYTILVHASGYNITAYYQLTVQSVTGGGCNGQIINCGQTVTTNTSFATEMDGYNFTGSAGQTLLLAFWWAGGGYSYDQGSADIYTPGNQFLTNVTVVQGGNAIRLTLPTSGTYTILVHASFYNITANYQLTIQSVQGICGASPALACGQTVSGQIYNHGQIDVHPMPISGGEHIIISTSGFAALVVELYDPYGTLISSAASGGTINVTLASTGTYIVLVHAGNYSNTGAYGLSLTVFGGCDRALLGSTIVLTQQVACLPVQLSSSSPAVWVSFSVQVPTNLLDNPTLLGLPQFTNATIVPGTNSQWLVTMQTDPANGVAGPTNIAMLCFDAVATQSAFVPVLLSNLVITNQGGGVPGATGFGGRVVIIADQPLLEAGLGTNRQRLFTLYGHPNTDYEINYSTNLGVPSPWSPGWTNTVPATLSYSGSISGPLSNAPVVLLRAQQR